MWGVPTLKNPSYFEQKGYEVLTQSPMVIFYGENNLTGELMTCSSCFVLPWEDEKMSLKTRPGKNVD